eukprot:766090-Hanusia_phi.AAC.6
MVNALGYRPSWRCQTLPKIRPSLRSVVSPFLGCTHALALQATPAVLTTVVRLVRCAVKGRRGEVRDDHKDKPPAYTISVAPLVVSSLASCSCPDLLAPSTSIAFFLGPTHLDSHKDFWQGQDVIWAVRECLKPLVRISLNLSNRRHMVNHRETSRVFTRLLKRWLNQPLTRHQNLVGIDEEVALTVILIGRMLE